MQLFINQSRWMSSVIRLCVAGAALTAVSMTAQAQTYYYYPTSVPAAPAIANVSNVVPTYYVQGTMGNQVVWYTYTVQPYQTAYTPQYYQTAYQPQYYQVTYQPQTIQTPSSAADTTPGRPPGAAATASNDAAEPAARGASTAGESGGATAAAEAAAGAAASDPYGFVSWLNSVRAGYGLSAVGHDPNLSNWAALNNNQQAAYGMGHFVMGPARRQNSAMGAFGNIGAMWMNSPAHRAALLDPTIRWIGIAGLGAYWTFNAN
jgi:hypothetical protein